MATPIPEWLPNPGWCCDGICGLSGAEASEFATCTCDAAVSDGLWLSRGECELRPGAHLTD